MIYLVTGGSGSGKSAYAEEKLCSLGNYNRIYFATMEVSDKEGRKKVERHRKLREGKAFTTIEQGKNLKEIKIPKNSLVLLECMSNLLANEMYQKDGSLKERGKAADLQLETAVLKPLLCLEQQAGCLVVVTNEVFSDGMRYEAETEEYVRLLGRANTFLAQRADAVIEVVCSIPLLHFHKSKDGGLPC